MLLYSHALLKVIILDGRFSRSLIAQMVSNRTRHHRKLTACGKIILDKVLK